MSEVVNFKFSPSMIHGAFAEDTTPCMCGHPKFFHPFLEKCRKGDCRKFVEDTTPRIEEPTPIPQQEY